MSSLPPLLGLNHQLALRHQEAALASMDEENAKLRGSGFNLDAAVAPYWNREIWEGYRAQFGEYPFSPAHKPPDVLNAPVWVKKICGVALTPAERMGGG